jgi:hypothetical protein
MLAHDLGERARGQYLMRELIPALQQILPPGPAQAESSNIQVFGKFQQGGRIIFDLTEALTDGLAFTEVDAIPCGDIPFITRSCYLHFGRSSAARSARIEGAFVLVIEGDRIIIDLVRPGFGTVMYDRGDRGEQLLGAYLLLSDPSMPAQQALAAAVTDVMAKNAQAFEQMDQMMAQVRAQYGDAVRVPALIENLSEHLSTLRVGLQLVINSLFYLSMAPEDVEEGWPENAPADLVRSSQDASAKQGTRRVAENTLKNAGYVKIRYVGRRYAASAEATAFSSGLASGRIMPTHVRGGHYRHQPYGPEHSLRKIILIKPMTINAHRADQSPGRIYVAPPPNTEPT